MPLYNSLSLPRDIDLFIWKIGEPAEFFEPVLDLHPHERRWLEKIHPDKKLEFLASRYLLYEHMGPRRHIPVIRDEFGKLRFEDGKHFLSISHSGPFSAFVAGPMDMGMDIQLYHSKVIHLLPKFLSASEREWVDSFELESERIKMATRCWSAKEAVYKAHGRRGIRFNEMIMLDFAEEGLTGGVLSLQEEKIVYEFNYGLDEEFVWIVAVAAHDDRTMDGDFM